MTLPVSASDIIDCPAPSGVVYKLRVPTYRSKSAAARDLMAEGVVTKSNADLINALLAENLSTDDATFLAGVQTAMGDDDAIGTDWSRVYALARACPDAAQIVADRIHHSNMNRLHLLRHHIILDGQKTPLPESAIDKLPALDMNAVVTMLECLIFPSEAEAKN